MNITVKVKEPYCVTVAAGGLRDSSLLERIPGSELMLVADSTVAALYMEALCERLRATGRRVGKTVFPAGERHKTLETVRNLLSAFASFGLTRTGCVVALGGGVTGDIAGFAAAIWLRGVPVVQVPTSLLAMVDSSVGGKTGVDLAVGKNLVGAFHQPSLVIVDPEVLATLPQERRLEGLAEMVKAGVIADETLFEQLTSVPDDCLTAEAISRSIRIKAEIVSRDEEEHGERKLLNLGHTAGHAIELASNYGISHGCAVAMGMAMVAQTALTPSDCRERLLAGLRRCGLPTESPFPLSALLDGMLRDKKRAGGAITLVVPEIIGRCRLVSIPVTDLSRVFAASAKTP